MGVRRVTINFTAGDTYATAIGGQTRAEVATGIFNVQGNPATVAMGEAAPMGGTSAPGVQLAVGDVLGDGPWPMPGAGIRLDQIWFRNTNAGSNATVVFVGVVRDVEGYTEE